MEELAAETPLSSAEEFEEFEGMEEGFEESFSNEMDGFEEDYAAEGFEDSFEEGFEDGFEEGFEDGFEAEFAEDYGDAFEEIDALEDALADALDAEDADEFFRQLLGGISRVAGLIGRGTRAAGQVAQTVGRVAGQARRAAQTVGRVAGQARRVAGQVQQVAGRAARARRPAANLLQQLMPLLQQYAAQGFDELDALEDLADLFAEEEMDEALPVIGAIAARAAVRPLLRTAAARLSRPLRQQLVRSGTQAARTLARRQGAAAVRALSPIARQVGRTAVRRRLGVRSLPAALRSTTARVAARPTMVQRLSRPVRRGGLRQRRFGRGGDVPRRLVLRGPVEIRIMGR
jgi:ABC-type transporter Mla subunit MlaD